MPRVAYSEEDRALVQPALGKAIQARRLARRIEVAQVSEHIGRTPRFVRKVEQGDAIVSLPILIKLCLLFDCTPDDLLGWEEK